MQGNLLQTFELTDDPQMVLQVFADALEFVHHINAMRLDIIGGTHATAHKNLRRINRPSR